MFGQLIQLLGSIFLLLGGAFVFTLFKVIFRPLLIVVNLVQLLLIHFEIKVLVQLFIIRLYLTDVLFQLFKLLGKILLLFQQGLVILISLGILSLF